MQACACVAVGLGLPTGTADRRCFTVSCYPVGEAVDLVPRWVLVSKGHEVGSHGSYDLNSKYTKQHKAISHASVNKIPATKFSISQ